MKNTKTMKNMKKFTNSLAAVALACLALVATACDKDDNDDDKGTALTLQEMVGTYSGSFDFTPSPSSINPDPQPESGIAVSFEVTDQGTVHFPEFPAATLVKALLGEEGASSLLPLLGTISYDVTIGTPASDDSKLSAALTTPQLRISIPSMPVLITIEAPDQLTYTKEGEIKFTLKTVKCQLGEGESAGAPFDLVNTLEFTAKKQ